MKNFKIIRIDIENFGCFKNYKQHGSSKQFSIGNDFNINNINIFTEETILEKVHTPKFSKVLN